MSRPCTVEPARTEDLAAAFRLLFRHSPADEQRARVRNALEMVRQGALDPAGVLVARAAAGLAGAVVCTPVPGAGGLVWPPQVVDAHDPVRLEDLLVQRACAWLRGRGVKLAQSLLAGHEQPLAAPLERNGFRYVTHLWYMRHSLELPLSLVQTPVRCRFEAFADCDRGVFELTLMRTYEGTQDCPEINGLRSVGEIIEGHQSQGLYDPERWWLGWAGETPAGVLLTTEMADADHWDLAYLGIVPEARRHGLGRELTLKAACEAKAAGASQLTLSVDSRNRPAWQLYRKVGFEAFDERAVYLALWPDRGD